MNQGHAELCSSARWAEFIAEDVLPAVLAGQDLDTPVLEVGPGYGAATALLAARCEDLTAVEIDPALAAGLRERFPTVAVVEGRGEQLPFPDKAFNAVLCFTMLHHMHSAATQDAMFAQAHRVLREGGLFAGSDSIASPGLRGFHHDDIYTPVDPCALDERLVAAGFASADVRVAPTGDWFSFIARRA